MPMEVTGKSYSEHTAEIVDGEIKRLVDDAQQTTKSLIEKNRRQLQDIAEALVKYETLSAEEVQQIVEGKKLDKPTVGDLLEEEQAKAPAATPQPDQAMPEPGRGPIPEPG